ncbi:tumor necrosis factor receptor superfamily member 16-like [Biomphalaria glabrata]|uniref:Tumor necrosis factor receptor superfamily member 16-like n=1 Tax=Biomphalaria glabrata TaxID=6526 RepID=A0A9W2YM30_BIOGL|nr:tumor necrosis factor receptor superfamily member 16-like [Biomphalaria glabrata]XP_055863762.1 tumor necrosis factor receptor superfamily member 16-like [Biomphalaria glabrata]XP_055863763.1 tumor necrosis factor receptor superfamily member 16-like [Biomphalaria glabrata]XP_055863764.1 tumor necrosis factor receptor superfamily member 16-like [Biomphalaria glabrata]
MESMNLAILFVSQLVIASSSSPDHGYKSTCDPGIPSRVPDHSEAKLWADRFYPSCEEGQYLVSDTCVTCEDGTFMTKKMAGDRTHQKCLKCSEPGMYEIIAEQCTRTRDAKIMCEDGFYRLEEPGIPCRSSCVRCDVCGVGRNMFKNFEGRECGGYKNTICCAYPDTVVVDDQCVNVTTVSSSTTTNTTTTTTSESPSFIWREPMQAQFVAVGAVKGDASDLKTDRFYFVCAFNSLILVLVFKVFH